MEAICDRKTTGEKLTTQHWTSCLGNRRLRAKCSAAVVFLAVLMMPFGSAVTADDEELAELTARLKEEPNRVDLLKERAILLRAESKPVEALSDLDKLRKLVPDDRDIHLQRALVLSALRREVEAEAELNAFLKLEATQARALALAERGWIRARTGRPELAITDFTDAIAIRPALALFLERGRLQEASGQLGAAAAGYQNGISRLGPSNPLIAALIRVQIQQGQFESVLALIDAELPRAPIKTLWLLSRAEVLSTMGKTTEAEAELDAALEDANQALEKRPTALHLLARAKVLRAQGRLDEARDDLQICLQITPRFAECRELLSTL